MEKATINGVEMAYEAIGAGDPVLLIGTGPIADSFAPLVSERTMTDKFLLIRYHQRRIDVETRGPAPVSFAQHAADAAALLEHLGVRRSHVAGHSTGAAIALQLAADRPELVHALALLEPPLLGVPSAAAFFENAQPALDAYRAGDREGAIARFLGMASGLAWETCRTSIEKHVPGGVAQAIADADNFFGSYLPALDAWRFGAAEAARISAPVLSVLGTETEQLFAESHALLHAWLPQLEDGEIQGLAHLLHMQRPEPVARCMAEFLARHPIADHWRGDPRIAPDARVTRTTATTAPEPFRESSPVATA
jgi:pimeloyl-ACP methyl ester carboxylesterase